MRTTVELPDDLLHQARAEAARRGLKLKDLLQEGLRQVLAASPAQPSGSPPGTRPTLYDLMKDGAGIVDSGIPDLASNPHHLDGLGRDSMGYR